MLAKNKRAIVKKEMENRTLAWQEEADAAPTPGVRSRNQRVLSKKMAAVPSKVTKWLKDGGGSSRIQYGGRGYTGPTRTIEDGPKAKQVRASKDVVEPFRTMKGNAWAAMPKGI